MSHPFDATLKDIFGHSAADLTPLLHLPTGVPARTLNIDLSTVSAASDVAYGFGEPLEQIVDVNFQSGPDSYVDGRLLLYNAAYHHHYPVPVRSVLILLRPAADHSRLTGLLSYRLGGSRVEFSYEVIRLWQQPLIPFLSGGLALLPLAPLCQLSADVPLEQALSEVIHQVDQRLTAEAPYEHAVKLMTATFVLTGLRMDENKLPTLFRGVKAMHDSSAFTYYEKKGRMAEGQRMLLLLGAERFGAPDQATEAALRAVEDLDRIERMAGVILKATSWQELLTAP